MTITAFQSPLPTGRQRYLALGRHAADAIAQINDRGLEAALEAVAAMGGATQRKAIARDLVKAAGQLAGAPSHRIVDYPRRRWPDGAAVVDRMVVIPHLTWEYRGDRQVGKIEWLPMFAATDRRGAPALRRPLPL